MGWQQKLKDATYQRVARKAGVRNLDSENDVRKIAAYIASNPGLNQSRYTSNARAAGVRNLDSRNDIRKIDQYLASRPSAPAPTPAPRPAPSPAPRPSPPPSPAPLPRAPSPAPTTDYSGIFKGYQDTIDRLSASYNNAISSSQAQAQAQAKSNAENADKLGNLQEENESLKQSNQKFLDASANDQLYALRSGMTTGSDNNSVYGTIGGDGSMSEGLSGGTTQYQDSSKGSSISADTPVENSVLSRKGPVVSQMNTQLSRQKGSPATSSRGLASGRAANYYSLRFS
mgnify:CR=1 FL=1|jgi:hypothetical protein